MKKTRTFLVCMLLLLSVIISTIPANAVNNNKNVLNITYAFDENVFGKVTVKVYKVANLQTTGEYTLTEDLSDCSVKLNGIQSQSQWNKVRDTLNAYVTANKIKTTQKKTTDKNGKVKFIGLENGLYLIPSVTIVKGKKKYVFESFLITVKENVTSNPKCEVTTIKDKLVEYEVFIEWDDLDNNEKRPDKVTVDIYEDGDFFDRVELSDENNWYHSWMGEDGGEWTVIQSDVPKDYTQTFEKIDNKFVYTNKYRENGSTSIAPQTGDYTTLWQYVVAMAASGMFLLIMAVVIKRRESKKAK